MFRNSIPLFKILGFQIKVDPSWLIIAALLVWSLSSGYFPEIVAGLRHADYVLLSVVAMLGLFASLILHELAHSLVARRYGLQIGSITLFLFGGVAELDEEPASARSEIRIAIVGPVASLTLAAVFWLAMQVDLVAPLPETLLALFGYLAMINLVLGLFNLMPAFPMDGGRVLRAALWARSGDLLAATGTATRVATTFAYALMGLGFFALLAWVQVGGVWFILIGLYLLMAAQGTYRQLMIRNALKGRTVGSLMTAPAVVTTPDETLIDLVEGIMLPLGHGFIPVIEGEHLLGYVDAAMLRSINRENWADTRVGDIFEPLGPGNSVSKDMGAEALLERITTTGRRKFLVAEDRHLAGVVSLSDLVSYLLVLNQIGLHDFPGRINQGF